MDRTEAKEFLIDQSAAVLIAQLELYEKKEVRDKALEPIEEAAILGAFEDLTPDEQWECFLEACRRIGASHNHPAFASQHRAYASVKTRDAEAQLAAQRQSAEWN